MGYDLRCASFVFAALRVLQNTPSPMSVTVVKVPPMIAAPNMMSGSSISACRPDRDGSPRRWVGLSMKPSPAGLNAHLPPHLREVCAILAAGLVWLCSRDAEDHARKAEIARGLGDIPLHSTARQRLHANPNRKGLA